MKRHLKIISLAGFLLTTAMINHLGAGIIVSDISSSAVESRVMTIDGRFGRSINGQSFQQDVLVSHLGYQYITYYDVDGFVCLARRKLPYGEWQVLRLEDYIFTSDDAHNVISMGICPEDGTIHLAFDHHGGPLHYRRSNTGVASKPHETNWDASIFGPIVSELEPGKQTGVTYPRFIQTPDGGLQFCYRRGGSGDGDRMLVDYCAKSGTWTNGRQIDSREGAFKDALGESDSRCSYPNGYTYGPEGKLHVTWVWRENAQGANHDLVYVFSEDGGNSWKNNSGDPLPDPPHLHSPGITVVGINRDKGLMNTHGQEVDSKGRVHVVMWHTVDPIEADPESGKLKSRWGEPSDRRYHHYFRDTCGTWQHRILPGIVGTRPKVFVDEEDNLIVINGTPRVQGTMDQGIYFTGGDLVIASASAESKWTDWKIIHVEKGPFGNEMLGDVPRFKKDGILSVMVQDVSEESRAPSPLRVIDFTFGKKPQAAK